jgi:hypothetical protein
VGYLLMRLGQNLLHLPPAMDMDIVTFLQFDGNPPQETPRADQFFTVGGDSRRRLAENGREFGDRSRLLQSHCEKLIGPQETPEKGSLTLAALRDRYLDTHGNGSLEKSTLEGINFISSTSPARSANGSPSRILP